MMKLPEFKTEAQERKFWEEHSIADYWKDLRESDDYFERPKLTPVTVKFDPLVLKKIKMLARKRGIPYNAYIRYLLARSVEDEIGFKLSNNKQRD
jgi:predicted DNA binding CopG/RHH family protein